MSRLSAAVSVDPASRDIVGHARDVGLLVARAWSAVSQRHTQNVSRDAVGAGDPSFDLGDRVYVGETDQLKRRFEGYRTPGVSQTTNIRLNAVLVALL